MSVLVRRFIIFTLICVNFAILLAALVNQPSQRDMKMHSVSSQCLPLQLSCGEPA